MAGTTTTSRDNAGHEGGALRDLLIQFNKLVDDVNAAGAAIAGTGNITQSTLSRGTTVTLAASANVIQIAGVRSSLSAETAKAFGSLGTIPASTWGLIAVERIGDGTTSFVSAAANYTTGYASEAAAIAALPAISANKVRIGYLTILASEDGWVAGTDALAGGTGGNPATTTHYTSEPAMAAASGLTAAKIGNANGTPFTT